MKTPFVRLRKYPLNLLCWQFPFMKVLLFSKSIPASIKMIMSSLLYSVSLMNYINWFLGVETILHSWNKYHLVFLYYAFYILLSSFISILSIYVHEGYWYLMNIDILTRFYQVGAALFISENVFGRLILFSPYMFD